MADADGRRRGEGGGVDGAPPVDAGRPRVCDRAGPGGGGAAGARVRGGTRGARSLPALTRGGATWVAAPGQRAASAAAARPRAHPSRAVPGSPVGFDGRGGGGRGGGSNGARLARRVARLARRVLPAGLCVVLRPHGREETPPSRRRLHLAHAAGQIYQPCGSEQESASLWHSKTTHLPLSPSQRLLFPPTPPCSPEPTRYWSASPAPSHTRPR